MDINELESFKLSDAVTFHDQLNPALWTEKGELEPDVKKQLMLIARDFMSELGISSLKVEDITISGSSAAYTYTPHSDLDLHILVDFNKLPDDEVYQELFNAKKTLYNDTHNIKVHGVPVELYVQDNNQPVVSLGEYSILKNEWLKIPKKRRANFDQNATKAKYEKLGEMVELALKSQDLEKIEKALSIIKRYRKAGLDKHGEFGPENLAFKALRSQGYIKKLYDLKNELHSRKLSIESAMGEDWHPNDIPPGPEFKPTMPKGTVRVDVSDVYDWYKLGQHISNMKGLGKHDFGKGPPSTILSFGDEDLEHQYIQALKKTGLDTTDIDPVDPNQPKWMKRQKTDPTYNVGVAEGGAETSWSDGTEKITLQDILELTKHIEQINLPINDSLKSKLLHWDGNPEEIERINQVTVSNKFPILVMLDGQGQIDWILDGNHRLHKAIKSQAKTIPAKLIKPSDLSDKARKVFHIEEQSVVEASGYIPSEKQKNDPRFKTALTIDVKPDSIKKNAKAFGWLTSRAGIPPKANTNGKI